MRHEFCDHCEGCRPAIMNVKTGRVMSQGDPTMIAINHVWDRETTYYQRKAFIELTLHNTNDAATVRLANIVIEKIQKVISNTPG